MQFGWPQSTKPGRGALLDPTHPLCQGLALCCAPNEGAGPFRDIITGQSFALASGTNWVGTPYGWGLSNVTTGLNTVATLQSPVSAPYAVTVAYQVPLTGSKWVVLWGSDSFSGIVVSGTSIFIDGPGGSAVASVTVPAHTPGVWAVVTVTLAGTASGSAAAIYYQGALVLAHTISGAVNPPTRLILGNNTSTHALASPIVAAAIHSRLLAPSEAAQLGGGPGAFWQLFAPGPLRSWVFTQGSGVLAGSSSGGVAVGGSSTPSVVYAPAAAGGAVIGGFASPQAGFTPAASGGTAVGGTSTPSASYTPAPSGGAVVGGSAAGSTPGTSAGLGYWPQVRKPARGASLHLASPLARGLVAFWPLWEGSGPAYDLVGGLPLALSAAASWGSGAMMGIACTSTTGYAQASAPASLQLAGPLSIAMGFRQLVAPGNNNAMLGGVTYASTNTTPFYGYAFQYGNSTSSLWLDINVAGVLHTVGSFAVAPGGDYTISASHQSGSQILYGNGQAAGSASNAGSVTYGAGPLVALGPSAAFARNPNILPYWMAIWSRVLDPSEHAQLAANPWRLFRPRPIFSGGGSTAFAGQSAGGAVAGGTAAPSVVYSPSAAGGAAMGGSASPSASFAGSSSGGAVAGGTAQGSTSGTFTAIASGGVVLGGMVTPSAGFAASSSGGAAAGGSAQGGGSVFAAPSAGGVAVGGLAPTSVAYAAPSAGGVVAGGSAYGSVSNASAPNFVDPDAGTLILTTTIGGVVDPDAGTLIATATVGGEVDPDAGTVIRVYMSTPGPTPTPTPTTTTALQFFMQQSSDHSSPSSATPTVLLCVPGGSWFVPEGAISGQGDGYWTLQATYLDTLGGTPLLLYATADGADPCPNAYWPGGGGWRVGVLTNPFPVWLGTIESSGYQPLVGVLPAVQVGLNSAAMATGGGATSEPGGAGNGNGFYWYYPVLADVAAAGALALLASNDEAIDAPYTYFLD